MSTLEGPVAYAAGDALLTGEHNEQWPVRRNSFETAYQARAPLHMGQDGMYLKRPQLVEARQLIRAQDVTLTEERGVLHGRPGDWLVQDEAGSQWIVEAKIFAATYDVAP
jgi:hypothetical protein